MDASTNNDEVAAGAAVLYAAGAGTPTELRWQPASGSSQWQLHERAGQSLAAGLTGLRRRLGLDSAMPPGRRPALCLTVVVGKLRASGVGDGGGKAKADDLLAHLLGQIQPVGREQGGGAGKDRGGAEVQLLAAAGAGEWAMALVELLEPLAAGLHSAAERQSSGQPAPLLIALGRTAGPILDLVNQAPEWCAARSARPCPHSSYVLMC